MARGQQQVNIVQDNSIANIKSAVPGSNPRSSRWELMSQVEMESGPLRATSDGTLVDEQTGTLVHLDTNKPRLPVPEMKNGATALDDPRARKPIARVIKNWLTASNRPPPDEPRQIFMVGDRMPCKWNLEEMIKVRRHDGGANVRYTMLKIMHRFWGAELTQEFDTSWRDQAQSNPKDMDEMEDFVLGLVVESSKAQDQEEVKDPAFVDSKKSGWFW